MPHRGEVGVTEKRVERRLAAILAADVVGYSRLTGTDEEGTVSRLRALRQELIDPLVAAHGGRIVKNTGDGRLIEFASVVDAVRCALEVQRGMTARNANVVPDKRIDFRVGIHLGDVMVESDGDLMGDGVNIAARLEGIAEPGGICLSNSAYDQVRDKVSEQFADLGDQELKNIARPVRVYRIEPKTPSAAAAPDPAKPGLALPDKPSIAVLPFQNMSGDSEQDYFCDGMVEDIITGLSRIRWLFVIARNSSFAYKGKSPDIRAVGRELGVRYVLEGSVRKVGNRVRITGQLIDATTGAHIWADRFEGTLDDVFDLQDRMTASVVGAITPALVAAEQRRAETKPTESLDAYDYYLRALAQYHVFTPAGFAEAVALCRSATALNSRYATPYGLAGMCLATGIANSWMANLAEARSDGIAFAHKAIELGADDPSALVWGGWALFYLAREYDLAIAAIDRSLTLDSNLARAWNWSGWARMLDHGDGNGAIERMERARRLSPLDPEAFTFNSGIAWAHFIEGRYDEAVRWADASLHVRPRSTTALRCKLAADGLLGRTEEANETMRALLAIQPDASVAKLKTLMPMRRPEDMARYLDGLRNAGVPEA